jgi:hypothetical protein
MGDFEIVDARETVFLAHPAHRDAVKSLCGGHLSVPAHDRNQSLKNHQTFPHDHDHRPLLR